MKERKLSKNTIKKYKLIIDEWFINEFNGKLAYKKIHPGVSANTAMCNFSKIQAIPEIAAYIIQRYQKASKASSLTHEKILTELEGIAMLDVSRICNLKTVENTYTRMVIDEEATKIAHAADKRRKKPILKEEKYTLLEQELQLTDFDDLTPLERRSINGVKQGRFGLEIKFKDSMQAMDMINKHKGFYEVDNRQKASPIVIAASDQEAADMIKKIINGEN